MDWPETQKSWSPASEFFPIFELFWVIMGKQWDEIKKKHFPDDLIRLSNVVDNDIVSKIVYDQLIITVTATNTTVPSPSGAVSKTKYNCDEKDLKKRLKSW